MLEANQIFQQRYQLKQKLAQNAGRQTWLAEDISIQPAETVILKFLAFGEHFQWQDLKLFEREADILKQLSHPRIPKYRDYFAIEDNHNWFALVEEYIPGTSLKQLIEIKQRFTEEELRKIATDVLEILCYLHTLNPLVIHRDIKPSNLIIGEDKRVYLIDFGAVQDSAAAQGATFTVVGTYGYAPIEQFGGRTVPASDLYALGATLIHLATGRIPADLPQTKTGIQFQDKVSLSNDFIAWIQKLTEIYVEDRFSSASEALPCLNSSLTVNASAEISKPQDSRIILNKSYNQLQVKILEQEHDSDDRGLLIMCSIMLIVSGIIGFVLPLGIFFFIFLCPFVFGMLISQFKTFYLKLNRDKFVIEWRLFDLAIGRKVGKASQLNNLRKSYFDDENGKPHPGVLIEAGVNKYDYFRGLDEAEIDWLIKEIQDWLNQ